MSRPAARWTVPISPSSPFSKQPKSWASANARSSKEILNETNRSLFWKFSLLLALIAWGTIFISHKIAGPFFRFSKAFSEVEKGDYRARIFLRKLDEGIPVAEEFNEALEKTDRLLSELKILTLEKDASQALAKIKEKLTKIQTSADA